MSETIKAQTLAYLDTHGDPHPEASHIETARRLLEDEAVDPNGRSDPAGTAARYIGKWRDDESDTSDSHANDGGTPEPSAPDREGVDDWSEVDQSNLTRVPSTRPECYRAWMDMEREQYLFDIPASNSPGLDDIPFAEVQLMVEQYVYEGTGQSQDQVATYCNNELNRDMTRGYLRDMFKALDITKTSPPWAYHRVHSEEPEELAQQQREKKEAAIEAKYRSEDAKAWRKRCGELKRELLQIDEFIDGLIERVHCDPPTLDGGVPARTDVADEMPARSDIVLASDWHIGKEVDVHGNRFDVDIARERVMRSTRRTIEQYQMDRRPLDEVVIAYLGDLIDGPHGDMHPEQWLGQDATHLEQLEVASTLMAKQVTMLSEYFDDVPVTVYCVGGNHGRDRKSRDEDPTRLPELAMYALAREKSPTDQIDDWHIHRERRSSMHIDVRGVHTVLTHGDRTPRDLADLGDVPHADQSLVVSGHGHEYELRQCLDGDTTVVQNGCLCGVTEFDRDEIGRHVRPTQATVEVGPHGPQPGKVIHCK